MALGYTQQYYDITLLKTTEHITCTNENETQHIQNQVEKNDNIHELSTNKTKKKIKFGAAFMFYSKAAVYILTKDDTYM